jgi:hypothetical protein
LPSSRMMVCNEAILNRGGCDGGLQSCASMASMMRRSDL